VSEQQRQWIIEVARDLKQYAGRSIIITGDGQPAGVHALVHAMNITLGNHRGKAGEGAGQGMDRDLPPVVYTRHVEAKPADQVAEIGALAREMERGQVEILLILGGNPVFNAPADLEFGERLAAMGGKHQRRIHLGLYQDETAVLCDWHIPEAHYLESWGDARAYDGTATIIQPLIAPLYGGRSAHEVLAAFAKYPEPQAYDIVHDYWQKEHAGRGDFEPFWQQALQRGIVPDFKNQFAPIESLDMKDGWASRGRQPPEQGVRMPSPGADAPGSPDGLEIVFRPDPTIFDGRFANNGWLQELPKPVTKLTWDNAALVSPNTAKALGVSYRVGQESGKPGNNGGEHGQAIVDMVELIFAGRTVRAPVLIQPGHADNSVTVHLGYGRTHAGQVGSGTGFNAYQLRTRQAMWFANGLEVRPLSGEHYTLACTQMHHGMNERAPVKASTLAEFTDPEHPRNREFAKKLIAAEHEADEVHQLVPGPHDEKRKEGKEDSRLIPLTLYDREEYPYDGYRWGMAIDLSACVGCSACVVACQAENNIPVVGKTEVTRGREMHWLRIDRYYKGDLDNPTAYFQPVPCMHCEAAPCELVCPVGATVHSHDGLNDMVYNRCVGTRYCSNNCPYKVRRFNFLQYADYATASLKLGHNPNVTVRSRGVMEKCTYCVQRIRAADIEAEKEGRHIRDGDVLTACQAACPADAIVFGDINDKKSKVYAMKAEPLNYALLAELNTQPRTTYLAALRNPNPRIT
jgi:molybdopterin-containing oxidoreductase family iron-sulfur binding subunit